MLSAASTARWPLTDGKVWPGSHPFHVPSAVYFWNAQTVKALPRRSPPILAAPTLFVVPLHRGSQEYIRDNAPDVLLTVLMRTQHDAYCQSYCHQTGLGEAHHREFGQVAL